MWTVSYKTMPTTLKFTQNLGNTKAILLSAV